MVKKYTMQDIAKAANVSKATVSYVLNEKSGARVSEQTRRKILQIANVYHYVPNLSAKYLGDTRKKLIGIVVGNDEKTIFLMTGRLWMLCMRCFLLPIINWFYWTVKVVMNIWILRMMLSLRKI